MQRVVEQRWGCQWTLSTKHFRLGVCRLDESEQQECTRRGPHENHNDEESYIDLSMVTDRCHYFLDLRMDEKVLSSPLFRLLRPQLFRTTEYIESGQRT